MKMLKEELVLIKCLNNTNKSNIKNKFKEDSIKGELQTKFELTLKKQKDIIYLINIEGTIVTKITTLADLISYLKESGCYIRNISELNSLKEYDYCILSVSMWFKIIQSIVAGVHYNSFQILKVSNIKEYVSKLVLTKKVDIIENNEYYIYLLVNNTDFYLLSELNLIVLDKTKLYFRGNIKNIKIYNLDISRVTDLSELFNGCSFTQIIEFKNFNTKNVTNFSNMFRSCYNLKKVNLDTFDTSNAIKLKGMFNACKSLETINLNSFDISNVVDFSGMFSYCDNLRTVYLDKWVFSNVDRSLYCDYMFYKCKNLSNVDMNQIRLMLSISKANNCMLSETKLGK